MTRPRARTSRTERSARSARPALGSVVTAERIIVYASLLLLVPGQVAATTGDYDGFAFGMFWSVGANALIGCVLFARLSYSAGDLTSFTASFSAEQMARRRAIYRSLFIDLAVVVLGQIIIFNLIAVIGAVSFPTFSPDIWGELYGVTVFGVLPGLGFVGFLLGALVVSPIVRSFGARADPGGRAMGIAFAVLLVCAGGMATAALVGSTDSTVLTNQGIAVYRLIIVLSGLPDPSVTITSPALAWLARALLIPTVISGAFAVHASRAVWANRDGTTSSRASRP